MVTINFQNKFSGKELTEIILESARDSDLSIDFNKYTDLPLKFKNRHIHLSRQIQNPVTVYDIIKKIFEVPKISCCFYLFDDVIYTNEFKFEIYLGLVKELKKGIRESDKNYIKIYPTLDSYLGKFMSRMKQKLNSSKKLITIQDEDRGLFPFPSEFAEMISKIYKDL